MHVGINVIKLLTYNNMRQHIKSQVRKEGPDSGVASKFRKQSASSLARKSRENIISTNIKTIWQL